MKKTVVVVVGVFGLAPLFLTGCHPAGSEKDTESWAGFALLGGGVASYREQVQTEAEEADAREEAERLARMNAHRRTCGRCRESNDGPRDTAIDVAPSSSSDGDSDGDPYD